MTNKPKCMMKFPLSCSSALYTNGANSTVLNHADLRNVSKIRKVHQQTKSIGTF